MSVLANQLAADPPVVRVSGLNKTFWLNEGTAGRLVRLTAGRALGGRALHALSDVSFDLRAGEAVGLLGRNGSGKSTLLSIITGTVPPTDGCVERRGSVASLLELGIGFQPERTGRENALVAMAMNGLSRERSESLLDEIAAFADIGQFFDMPVRTYSTGMFVRLAFAAQSVLEPDIWIVDEALSVGDFGFRQRALTWLRRFVERGGGLLLATHDTSMVDAFCSRALVLDAGRLVHDGPVPAASLVYISRYSQPGVRGTDADWPSAPSQSSDTLDAASFIRTAYRRPPGSDYLDRHVELLGVRIENSAGESTTEFASGDTLRVRCAFRVHDDRPHVTATVHLRTEAGLLVWAAGAVNARVLLRVESGGTYLTAVDVVLNLQPGRYSVSVGLATANLDTNARTAEFHDFFRDLTTIELLGPPSSEGVAFLPHLHPPAREVHADEPRAAAQV
jgi:lipopolysaccharide transport system ATP-binding protein